MGIKSHTLENCKNTCPEDPSYSSDGICDDGGSGASYYFCSTGTDCNDCGPRPYHPPQPPPLPPRPPYSPGICNNECPGFPQGKDDGVCDDGGPESRYEICNWDPTIPGYGSDCNDCGPREPQKASPTDPPPSIPLPPNRPGMCSETCEGAPFYASDGVCDDGGPGSEYDKCKIGTDCSDCGVALFPTPPPKMSFPTPVSPHSSPAPLRLNPPAIVQKTSPKLTSFWSGELIAAISVVALFGSHISVVILMKCFRLLQTSKAEYTSSTETQQVPPRGTNPHPDLST